MFHNRKLNNHKKRIHERALRIVNQVYNATFDELLAKDSFFKIHDCNLQKLVKEMFKVNPLTTNVPHHIETSQLICTADQLTGFYTEETLA